MNRPSVNFIEKQLILCARGFLENPFLPHLFKYFRHFI